MAIKSISYTQKLLNRALRNSKSCASQDINAQIAALKKDLRYLKALSKDQSAERFSNKFASRSQPTNKQSSNTPLYTILHSLLKALHRIKTTYKRRDREKKIISIYDLIETTKTFALRKLINSKPYKHAAIIRCKKINTNTYKLVNSLSTIIPKKSIFICHDDENDSSKGNKLSMVEFRRNFSLNLSTIPRPGWRFGDFCHYAVFYKNSNFNFYVVIDEDVFLNKKGITDLFSELLLNPKDFLALHLAPSTNTKQHWYQAFKKNHGEHNEITTCRYQITRSSARLIPNMIKKRYEEFINYSRSPKYGKNNTFGAFFFPNDEIFSASYANSMCNRSTGTLSTHFLGQYHHIAVPVLKVDNQYHPNICFENVIEDANAFHRKLPKSAPEIAACIELNATNELALNIITNHINEISNTALSLAQSSILISFTKAIRDISMLKLRGKKFHYFQSSKPALLSHNISKLQQLSREHIIFYSGLRFKSYHHFLNKRGLMVAMHNIGN